MSEDLEGGSVTLVPVTLELPAGLVAAYDAMVAERIYPDRESALLHGLVESWRHNRGAFHTIRVDLLSATEDAEDRGRAETSDGSESGAGEG